MRIQHRYYTSDSHTKTIKPVKFILDKFSVPYKYQEEPDCVIPSFKHRLEFYLYEDDPNFERLKNELSKFKIEPQIGTEYEKTDVKKADWFFATTGEYQYPQPEDDFGYLKATFNLDNYCNHCGIGKVQNAPFRLRTLPKQHNNQFWGLHWEFDAIFIRQEAKNILERENIKGVRFSDPVLHKKNTPVEGFHQLHIEKVLDKGFDSYNTNIITCKLNNEENNNTDPGLVYCGRVKFHHPRIGGYLFDKNVFNTHDDMVESEEYFGSGASACRLQIVSKRFKDLVEKNNLKGLKFIPVMHERFVR